MKSKRHALCDRIRSARSWLNRAEKSFTNENDMEGEINLLLAEAELQHLREKEGAKSKRRRHFLAFGTAAFVAMAFFAMTKVWQEEHKPLPIAPEPVRIAAPETAKSALPSRQGEKTGVTAQVIVRDEPPLVRAAPVEEKMTIQAAGESISEGEMRDLVRTAGKTLRSNI
jgi:hypothetical protein